MRTNINTDFDQQMMERALTLATNGRGFTSPNPMVGAVITSPDGTIIGEGWHRCYGQPHAEVNAVASVSPANRALLPMSTIYVTLEPCSHYGKTPPCALLLKNTGFARVVAATVDPNVKVAGRGLQMLRDAGIQVEVGVLEKESRELNKKFFTAHILHRPFITLKWACSADGFMDHRRSPGQGACRFSTPLTSLEVMKLRADHDAVLTTSATVIADNCRLSIRGIDGRQPRRIVLDRHCRLLGNEAIFADSDNPPLVITEDISLPTLMHRLREQEGITSLLVESGPKLLQQFIDENLWDDVRVEVAPLILGEKGTHPSPALPTGEVTREYADGNSIITIKAPRVWVVNRNFS